MNKLDKLISGEIEMLSITSNESEYKKYELFYVSEDSVKFKDEAGFYINKYKRSFKFDQGELVKISKHYAQKLVSTM